MRSEIVLSDMSKNVSTVLNRIVNRNVQIRLNTALPDGTKKSIIDVTAKGSGVVSRMRFV